MIHGLKAVDTDEVLEKGMAAVTEVSAEVTKVAEAVQKKAEEVQQQNGQATEERKEVL